MFAIQCSLTFFSTFEQDIDEFISTADNWSETPCICCVCNPAQSVCLSSLARYNSRERLRAEFGGHQGTCTKTAAMYLYCTAAVAAARYLYLYNSSSTELGGDWRAPPALHQLPLLPKLLASSAPLLFNSAVQPLL